MRDSAAVAGIRILAVAEVVVRTGRTATVSAAVALAQVDRVKRPARREQKGHWSVDNLVVPVAAVETEDSRTPEALRVHPEAGRMTAVGRQGSRSVRLQVLVVRSSGGDHLMESCPAAVRMHQPAARASASVAGDVAAPEVP